jgi:hypothetical protein
MSRGPIGVLGAAALLALGGVLSGCGATANAHPLRSNGPITKTEAILYAQAVNLIPADVPEMVSVSQEGEDRERNHSVTSRCGLRESHVHVVDIHSPTFRSGDGLQLKEVLSDVEVVPTVALADRKLAQIEADIRSPRARGCLEHLYTQIFARSLTKGVAGRARVRFGRSTLTFPHPSVPRSFGLRLRIPFTVTGTVRSIGGSFDVDAFGFLAGRAAIGLTSFGFSRLGPTEQRLLSLLHSRA